ncbi:MAG: hypothetical protein OEV66_09575 [Spirochaetia bacterium]|nr:hypothetical protein [Spirochaetia bacterium]
MKNFNPVIIHLILTLGISSRIFSLDISVEATNKTLRAKAPFAEKVSVIRLDETMKIEATRTDISLPTVFKNLPDPENASYMIQVTHNGVNYNKVLPAGTMQSPLYVNIDIYDATNQMNADIKLEKFVEIHYFKGVLATDITLHFTNTGNYTFSERAGRNGVLVYIPNFGKSIEAIASLEGVSGASDIKTIKLNPQPLPGKPDYYLLDQAVKPGEKYFQVRVLYKYQGEPVEIPFENIYPLGSKLTVILHAKDMKIQWKENPAWDTKPVFNDNLGADFITLPMRQNKYTLIFSGGIPESGKSESGSSSNKPIGVNSPVNFAMKTGGVGLFLLLVTLFFYYLKSRPTWLRLIQSKNKSRLAFELQNLKSLDLSQDVKDKREKILKLKIESLEKLSRF